MWGNKNRRRYITVQKKKELGWAWHKEPLSKCHLIGYKDPKAKALPDRPYVFNHFPFMPVKLLSFFKRNVHKK